MRRLVYATVKARYAGHIYALPVVGVDVEYLRLRYDADRIISIKGCHQHLELLRCRGSAYRAVRRSGPMLESCRMWPMAVRLSRRPAVLTTHGPDGRCRQKRR